MRKATLLVAGAVVWVCSAPAVHAQNFLLNSAETINKGNFKLGGYPMVLFGDDEIVEDDNTWGVAARVGYGFSSSFDVEGKFGFFDGFNLYGADAEYWLLKGETDMSVSGGFHLTDSDAGVDSTAFDAALIVSRTLANRWEPYAGLSLSFESLDDIPDSDFTRVYVVPGVEYRIRDNLDLVAEFGIGLNDDSPNYLAFGLAYYVR